MGNERSLSISGLYTLFCCLLVNCFQFVSAGERCRGNTCDDNYFCCNDDKGTCCPTFYFCTANGICINILVLLIPALIVFSIVGVIAIIVCINNKKMKEMERQQEAELQAQQAAEGGEESEKLDGDQPNGLPEGEQTKDPST